MPAGWACHLAHSLRAYSTSAGSHLFAVRCARVATAPSAWCPLGACAGVRVTGRLASLRQSAVATRHREAPRTRRAWLSPGGPAVTRRVRGRGQRGAQCGPFHLKRNRLSTSGDSTAGDGPSRVARPGKQEITALH